ncbi:MAG: hypothetical protein EOM40_06420 [Clostridia bacterium]|nr:hypothetical protein [Clostridia bacterium]NCC42222.1 hypothetical protein [Clostridia bacterium]
MKKGLIKVGVLLLLFLTTVGITAVLINRDKTVGTRTMEAPTLPVVYMEVADVMVNPMYGHAQEMEQQYMRDSLTPLPTTRELTMVMEPMGSKVESVSYEVSTADGTTVVENSKISGLKEDGDYTRADFQLETPILMNQEYTLRFDVTLEGGKTYFYYTRLLQRAGINTDQYLAFVEDFYQKCLNSETASDIATYLEPDETQTNSTYTTLNIHSSFDRITWGDMETKLEKKAVPVIKDINETTCSMSLYYVISDQNTDEEDVPDYYNVADFYRMRYSQSRVMLLDFERTTQELYDGEHTELTSNGINLGIVDKAIQYQSNKNADIVAFVEQGELWSYNRSANKTTKVFSFRDSELDARTNLQEHGIKIVRVEESGDIDFVVYGYMNRDVHEGEVGIAVYHYGAELNQIDEELFIPVNTSYEYLKSDMEMLSYVTQDDMLYILLEDDLYQIDIKAKTSTIIQEDLQKDCYVISKSQASIAWMNEMSENASSTITVMNLENGESYTISAGDAQKIKAIGFINEDLIYGLANDVDIVTDNAGNTTFAMSTVRIERFGGEVVKEHHEDSIWVSNVKLEEGLIELERVQWEENAYVAISSAHIMNNLQTNEETVNIRLITTERKATQIGLDFDKSVKNKNVMYVNSNIVDLEQSPILNIELVRQENNIYYVYAKGVLDSTWTKASDAILRADTQMGVVLNRQQQYIWERGNRADIYTANLEDIPPVVLSGTIDESTLQQSLGEEYTVMNMTGCTLDSVLYQVGKGNPVIAKVSDTINVVIIGYNAKNTILYYPATQEQGYFGMQDSTAMFERAGNVFIGYMESMGEPSKGE